MIYDAVRTLTHFRLLWPPGPVRGAHYEIALRPEGVGSSPVPLATTPEALDALLASVGSQAPETGAKLFGPRDTMGIDVVEFDEEGSVKAGGTVYSPDTTWGNERVDHWLAQAPDAQRVWTGDAHSHPGDSGHPSQEVGPGLGDLGYVKAAFVMNPYLEVFFLPIITGTDRDGPVKIWPWVVLRDNPTTPLWAELQVAAVDTFGPRLYSPAWEAQLSAPPIVEPEKELESPAVPEELIEGGEAESVSTARAIDREQYFARTKGALTDEFHDATIVASGTGGGAYLIEKLARLGPKRLVLVDPDVVEVSNLPRTAFELGDIGRPKVEALADRIKRITPFVEVVTHQARIQNLDPGELLAGADLLIAGTDSVEAQRHCNTIACAAGLASVFIGIHEGALGGRLIASIPGRTACYRCTAPDRYEEPEGEAANHDLHAETGLLPNMLFVDAIAFQLIVAVLERDRPTRFGAWLGELGDRSHAVARCDPAYPWGNAIVDALLADLPTEPKAYADELRGEALFAADSYWLSATRDPNCPDCGNRRHER